MAIWTEDKLEELPVKNGFRLRGLEITRLETFTDAAFAFATTMLVISVGKIPVDYPGLIAALKAVPSFIASFALIMLFWAGHRKWSRRYGLEDVRATLLSLTLVFVILVYVYPLRLMSSATISFMSGGFFPSEFKVSGYDELNGLFMIYGFGFTAMGSIIAMLYWHSQSTTESLCLNDIEKHTVKSERISWAVLSATGLVSALWAWLMPPWLGVWSGMWYVTLNISMPLLGWQSARNAPNG
jgi:uncharacterized membrane protein